MVMQQPQAQQGVSLNPDTFSEGGGAPVQKNLRIQEARYEYFDYEGKANRTFAARLNLVDDAGQTYVQRYSVGDPTRWTHSPDGKQAIPMVQGAAITKTSNFGILLAALVNAGFPKEQLGADISVLDNLYAYWDGVPEPEGRSSMRTPEQQRARIILVPMQILQAGAGGVAPVAAAPVAAMPPGMAPGIAPAAAPFAAPAPVMAPPAPAPAPVPTAAPAPVPATADDSSAKILASVEKISAATGGQFTLTQLFPQIQADYPAEAMVLMPQVTPVLTTHGFAIDPNTQAVTRTA